MAVIRPFKALRPVKEAAQLIASRPYDVLNVEEARNEANGNALSFLHVTRAEIDLPPGIDVHSPEVYERAKLNLQKLIDQQKLKQDDHPFYYIYQLIMDGRSQTGLVCVSSIDDYHNNRIKKHEFTRPEKEKDRIDHMRTIRAQTGNVFIAYNNVKELDALIEHWKKNQESQYNFKAADGIRHTIWVVNHPAVIASITALFNAKVPATYIADGHHRAASAAKVAEQLPDSRDAKFFLTTIFPASQLQILDYNRVVKDLNGLTSIEFLEKLALRFDVEKSDKPVKPSASKEFGMYMDRQWYRLRAHENILKSDPVGVLDISILSENLLDPILGIKDQRTDKRIDFVGGIRGLKGLEEQVNSGEMAVAFSLFPVTIQQLFAIADSGEVMPPKSTWFEPKLRDGLLTHLI